MRSYSFPILYTKCAPLSKLELSKGYAYRILAMSMKSRVLSSPLYIYSDYWLCYLSRSFLITQYCH